jgi:hypothetical protein
MILLRHIVKQICELLLYCWANEVWWPVFVCLLLLVAAATSVGAAIITPYIYTLF